MTRNTILAEDCVFRLDYRDKFRRAFPMTFNKVGLSDDEFRIYDRAPTPTQAKKISFDMMRKVGRN
jgi:hypothetical protein